MKKTQKLMAILIMLTILLSLTACKKPAPVPVEGESSTSGTGGEVGTGVQKQIVVYYPNFMQPGGQADTTSIFQKTKEAFESKYSAATLELNPIEDPGHYFDYVAQDMAAGKQIDVFISWDERFMDFINAGSVLPLDESLGVDQAYFDQVYDSETLRKTSIGGVIYALPIGSVTSGMYYNKNIISKYNIELKPDWTWDDFLQICTTISKGDKILPDYGDFPRLLQPYVNGRGLHFFNENNTKANFENPIFLDGIKLGKKVAELNAFYPASSYLPFEDLNNGNFAFLLDDQLSLTEYQMVKSNYTNVDVINIPVEGEDGFFRSMNAYACISKKSNVAADAFEYLKVLISKEVQNEQIKVMGFNPVNKEVLKELSAQIPEEKVPVFEQLFRRSKNFNDTSQTRKAYQYIYTNLYQSGMRDVDLSAEDMKEMNGQVENILQEPAAAPTGN